jgi:hypothetical protein
VRFVDCLAVKVVAEAVTAKAKFQKVSHRIKTHSFPLSKAFSSNQDVAQRVIMS